jgi:hypothetical protein
MLAKVCWAAVNGVEAHPVEAEADAGHGGRIVTEGAASAIAPETPSAPGGMTRRRCIRLATTLSLGGAVLPWHSWAGRPARARQYHLCLNPETVLQDPDFPALLARAGVSCVWLAGFFYGHWPWPLETLTRARDALCRAGLEARVVNVPLGHPGDSLGSRDGSFPLTPPAHWRLASNRDGKTYAGTSLHAPATAENAQALRKLRRAGFSHFFLDDDFRLARGPGEIGGCFCEEHRARFLRRAGLSAGRWPELLDDLRARRFTALLRQWVEFTCDELTGSFRAQQRAAGGGLGIMVMYLGAEKAGIRLADYRHVPLRVGELMFDDRSFSPLKGKTDELFSVLFHRRFAAPESAYSETTAYPADRLSAEHLAAKLVMSTVADVRHTSFMSGVTPFPKTHWTTLAPAMRRQAGFHAQLAGHTLRGPFKHYWGETSRYAGDDHPFSLFLATGVPFELTDRPARDGWTFLSDADAAAAANGKLVSRGTRFLCRPSARAAAGALEPCEEGLDALLALKHRILPALGKVPFVENDEAAVLAWYPSARRALLWNARAERTTFLVRCGAQTREVTLGPLESGLLADLQP